jgi:hypothetical protein
MDIDDLEKRLQTYVKDHDVSTLELHSLLESSSKDTFSLGQDYIKAYRRGFHTLASILSSAYAQKWHQETPDEWLKWSSHDLPFLFRETKGTPEDPVRIEIEHAPSFIGHKCENILIKTTSIKELSQDTHNCVILLPGSAYKDGKRLYTLESYDAEVKVFKKGSRQLLRDMETLFGLLETTYGPMQETSTRINTKKARLYSVRSLEHMTCDIDSFQTHFSSVDGTLLGSIRSLDALEEKSMLKKYLATGGVVGAFATTAFALDTVFLGGALTLTTLVLGKKALTHMRQSQGMCGYGISITPIAYAYTKEQIERYRALQYALCSSEISHLFS